VKSGWDVWDEVSADAYFWSIRRNYDISHPLLVAASRQAIEEFLDNQANETEEEDEYEHKRAENKRAEAAVRSVEAEKVKRNEDAETDAVAGDANRAAKDSDHESVDSPAADGGVARNSPCVAVQGSEEVRNMDAVALARRVLDAAYEQYYKSCYAHEPALAGKLTDVEVARIAREWAARNCWIQYDT